ncbi:MAG TPA: lipoprotein [Gemmatimonadales bacterium]|nr:lipoprotein [Gemmatimonadales bacterium]
MSRLMMIAMVVVLAGCGQKPAADVPAPPPPPPAPATGGDLTAHPWTLVRLGERANPLGAGGRRRT